jgi:hypothetical protein
MIILKIISIFKWHKKDMGVFVLILPYEKDKYEAFVTDKNIW